MKRLVLGTRNRKKCEELRDLLRDLPVTVLDMTGWSAVPEPEETETTFAGNALLKATAYALATGEWVLAEDSGLVVPALNGQPGVLSARYAGLHGDDAANNVRLLTELAALPQDCRAAYYVCSAVLVDPAGQPHGAAEGRCHGVILYEARGTGGFGYDPLFLVPEYHRTFGELSWLVKQALSHRARAIVQLRPAIRLHLKDKE